MVESNNNLDGAVVAPADPRKPDIIDLNINPAGASAAPAPGKKNWTVGTLTYTVGGLVGLFSWLLWGDFAWQMKDRAVPQVMQLIFKKYGASDLFVGLIFRSFPLTIGMLTGPFISYLSDHHRGRWGRRIPFMFLAIPLVVTAIFGLAFSPQLGGYAFRLHLTGALEMNMLILILLAMFWMLFDFSSSLANTIFGGLVNDVVPQPLIGRFYALFRVVSLIVGIIFNYWLFGKSEAHYTWIFAGIGILYGVGFTMLCLNVKEGEYPPPSPAGPKTSWMERFLVAAKAYLKAGYGRSYYLWYYAAYILAGLSMQPIGLYGIFFAKSLNVSMDVYGKCMAYAFMISLCLTYPLGALVDRFHPLRLLIVILVLDMILFLTIGLYVNDARVFPFAVVVQAVLGGCYWTVMLAFPQKLLSRDKFLQIQSAGGTFDCLIGIMFAPLLGIFLDYTHHAYRYIYYVGFVITALALVVNLILYRKFKAFGGPNHYVAPE